MISSNDLSSKVSEKKVIIYHEGRLVKARHPDERVKREIFPRARELSNIIQIARVSNQGEFHAIVESWAVQTCGEEVLHQSVVKAHSARSADSRYQCLQLANARIKQSVTVINSVESCSVPWELYLCENACIWGLFSDTCSPCREC